MGNALTRMLAIAAAFFTITMPRMSSGMWLMFVREIWKLSTARRVWIP